MTTSHLYDYVLSPFYDKLAQALWPRWVHPNVITLLGGAFALSAAVVLDRGLYGYAFWFFTMYHMCDNMDGKHARRTGQTSRFGGFLDHVVDGTLGNYAGCNTMAIVVFGRDTSTNDYPFGWHSWTCLWLEPHVVHHFSGQLILGTKLFSIDEAFLLTSAALAAGWIWGPPLYAITDSALYYLFQGMRYTAISHVIYIVTYDLFELSTRSSSSSNPISWRKYLFAVAYLLFWSLDPLLITTTQWWCAWLVIMPAIVWQ